MRILMLLLITALAGCAGQTAGQAAAANPDGSASPLKVADIALQNGAPTVALRAMESLLAADPRNSAALLRQAKAQLLLGNAAAAETSYRRVLAIDGHLDEARLGLAKIWLRTDPVAAERVLLEALDHDSRNTSALNNLGVARDLQGKHPEAQEAYRRALEAQPGLASARENLGLSLALSGKPQEGVKMLDQVAQEDGPADRQARDNWAVALTLSGHSVEAGQVLQEELSRPDVSKALAGYQALQPPAPAAVPPPATTPQ
jgi:Flp pilus assembly protein TadD